jgi:hypothetical protein
MLWVKSLNQEIVSLLGVWRVINPCNGENQLLLINIIEKANCIARLLLTISTIRVESNKQDTLEEHLINSECIRQNHFKIPTC